jgi:hypothetical protein
VRRRRAGYRRPGARWNYRARRGRRLGWMVRSIARRASEPTRRGDGRADRVVIARRDEVVRVCASPPRTGFRCSNLTAGRLGGRGRRRRGRTACAVAQSPCLSLNDRGVARSRARDAHGSDVRRIGPAWHLSAGRSRDGHDDRARGTRDAPESVPARVRPSAPWPSPVSSLERRLRRCVRGRLRRRRDEGLAARRREGSWPRERGGPRHH